jgi:hypothetical protein
MQLYRRATGIQDTPQKKLGIEFSNTFIAFLLLNDTLQNGSNC